MKRCRRCDQPRLEAVVIEDHADVDGHIFTAQLPGDRCRGCGTVAIEGHHVRRFELRIAAALAKSGQRSPAAFRYMRGVLDLTADGVAQLCGVDAELVALWESGRLAVDARALALVAGLVRSKAEDRAVSVDVLGVLRAPRPLARTVRITLDGAPVESAQPAQLGAPAPGAPALA